ncbi:MAG: hypothetical protein E7647_03525 [Ruminococcaceae bacterium]|nr:hypothetical protein [Oscillospiraceae bacterium]
MKKFFIMTLAAIMCAVMLFSCAKPEPVAKDIVDDDGKTVGVGYYDGDKLVREEKFDSNGKIAKRTEYDKDGRVEKVENYTGEKLMSEESYTYEKEEGSYSKKVTVFTNKGVTVSVKEIKYKDSLPVEEINTIPSSEEGVSNVERGTYKYLDDGSVLLTITSDAKQIRETLTDKKGNVVYDHEFNDKGSEKSYYNENNAVAKKESYDAEGKLTFTVENQYDEKGVISGSKTYDAKGTLMSSSVYVYKDSKLLGIYNYFGDGTIKNTVQYDENGKATIHNGTYVPLG